MCWGYEERLVIYQMKNLKFIIDKFDLGTIIPDGMIFLEIVSLIFIIFHIYPQICIIFSNF